MSFMKVEFFGRLGRDPELQYTPSGTAICTGSAAKNSSQKNCDDTLWVNFVAFGKTAELIQNKYSKGDAVFFSGELDPNNWTDKEGNQRKDMKLIVRSVNFIDSKTNASDHPDYGRDERQSNPIPPDNDDNKGYQDDLPF